VNRGGFGRRRRRTGAPLLALLAAAAALPAIAQDAGNVRAGAESYHDTIPGESVNGIGLDFRQLLPFGGVASGEAILVSGGNRSTPGRAVGRVSDVPAGPLVLTGEGGDLAWKLDASPYHFADDYPAIAYMRGGGARAEGPAGSVAVFAGRNERIEGIRLPTVVFAPESLAGATAAFRAGTGLTLDANAIRTSNREPGINPLFGSDVPRSAESYGAGATVRLKEFWIAQGRVSYQRYEYDSMSSLPSGHFLSYVAGTVLDTERWKAQADYIRQGLNYVPLSTASVGNREGPHVLLQSFGSRLVASAAFSSYRNNPEDTAGLTDLHSRSAFLSATWRVTDAVSTNWMVNAQDLSSTKVGETSRFTQRTASADVSAPTYGYTRLKYQYQTNEQPSLSQRIHEIELEQQPPTIRGFQLVAAFRFQREVGGASSVLFRGGVDGAFGDVRLSLHGEWGRDLAASTVFDLNRSQTVTAALSAPLPGGLELRVEGYWNRISAAVNPESIFASQITQEQLFSANRRTFLVRLVRSFGWGREPVGPAGPFSGPGRAPYGDIEGTVFRDANGNGRRDEDEPPIPGIAILLDDGQVARTDASGHFVFHNVVEGAHTVRLDLDVLPVAYNPPRDVSRRLQVARLVPAREDFALVPTGRIRGRVEQELSGGERVAFARAVVTILPNDFSTYTDEQGNFAFENLPPGRYRVRLEEASLPEGATVTADASPERALAGGEDLLLDPFVFLLRIEEKPVQKIFQNDQVVPSPSAPSRQRRGPRGSLR
jgi:hypothetical protein